MTVPVLTLEGVTKSFGPVRALDNVTIEVPPRSVIGLVGENGAGKSTLLKILSGVYQPDAGTIRHEGRSIVLRSPSDAARAGIGMVHQEQSLLGNISVAENIYLGDEARYRRFGLINWSAMHRDARRQLAKVKLDIDPARQTDTLSFADRQMVELAKAMTLEETVDGNIVLFLDEPTSVLERAEIATLFERVRALRSRASFVFVSHRIDEVLDISDSFYVMKDGKVVAHRPSAGATSGEIHALMVGRDGVGHSYAEDAQTDPGDGVVLSARGLGVPGGYREIDFDLRAGEVLGIAGVVGSGREALSRTVAGLLPHAKGTLSLLGKPVVLRSPQQAVRLGIGYVPQERKVEGLVLPMSVTHNVTMPALPHLSSMAMLPWRGERDIARKWVEKLSIRPPNVDLPTASLSGGNQQKVVLAKWIEAGVRVLILDHPTRGLDVGAKQDVYALVREISAQGVAILLTADTLEETIGLSHRILVMKDGMVMDRLDARPGAKPAPINLIRSMV